MVSVKLNNTKAFSAPGKAFVAGGYLVLEPIYDAYVVALSSRMHAVVTSTDEGDNGTITIRSPQFKDAEWSYVMGKDVHEVQGRKNPFLSATVEVINQYLDIHNSDIFNINITIFSDAGFHTQADTTTKTGPNGHKSFLYHKANITEVAKTGLGSSASLVSVVSTAIMSQFDVDASSDVLHNIAQIAHCKAQKKIGSGFDVATAVYGSIRYRRFEPAVIDGYLQHPNHDDLKQLVESKWNFKHDPCALPPHIRLLMGDIKGGSETPKLVSIVLNWKKQHPEEALQLYTNLNAANLSLMDALTNLHHYYTTNKPDYMKGIIQLKQLAAINVTEEPYLTPFVSLIDAIKNIRLYLKQLTVASTADIEPDSQTELLDNCNTINGCLGGVVPGAGGYDAISLLVIDESIDSIIDATRNDPRFSTVTWLNLTQQADGIVPEALEDYEGFD